MNSESNIPENVGNSESNLPENVEAERITENKPNAADPCLDAESRDVAAAKSAVWYTLATLLTKGLSFITIPIFTRIMTTAEFGLFNNFAAWQIIFLALFGLESYSTLNRARLDFYGKDLQNYQFTLLTAGILLTCVLALFILIYPEPLEALTELDSKYLYVMVLYLLFAPSFDMYQMLQRIQYRYKLSAALSVISSLAATILSVILVMNMSDALMGRIVGQYIPFVILGLVFYIWYWVTGGRFETSYLRYALPIAIPLVISVLGSQVLLLGCRIVAQHTVGSDEVAYLSLATSVSQIVLLIVTALNNAWSPWLYDCLEEKKYANAEKAFQAYFWAITILALFVSLLAPELVYILGGEDYEPTISLVPSFMITCLLSMITNQYVYVETYYKDVKVGGIVTLIVGVLNLPLCWLFIESFGFEYVGYANVISNFVLVLIHKVIVKKFEAPDLFSFKSIAVPTILSVVSVPVCLALYTLESSLLRYIIIAVCVAICIFWVYKNWSTLSPLLKKFRSK